MYDLSLSEMRPVLSMVSEAVDTKLRPVPIMFFKYLDRLLQEDRKQSKLTFPMTIKIPKPNKYLLRKDFEPAYVIELKEPLTMDDGETPIWLNSSTKQIYLRFGYKNNDGRYLSDEKLSMEYIHCFMGGSSGHGKSVTLNSLIGAICYEYAPWEVEINLSDAKIVEFKKYGVGHRIPHIRTIAATEDPDFIISVLDKSYNEMMERGKIFGNLGVSNLKGFREATGLAMPRVVIFMDEVESSFRLAGKQASTIAKRIDEFARLGRAAGYHIFMATQNMSSDIPASAIGQIRNRYCLGATEKVSTAVLGNSGATENVGRIGMLIANTEAMGGGDSSLYNVKYQTPLLDDKDFAVEMEFLEAKGKQAGFRPSLSFYDEDDVKTVAQFDTVIDSVFKRMQGDSEIDSRHNPLVLGYPAFVSDDPDELLKVWLTYKDMENILITSTMIDHIMAQLHNISKSLYLNDFAIQVFGTESEVADWVVNPRKVVEARSADEKPLSNIGSLVRKRLFLLELDSRTDGARFDRQVVEECLKKEKIPMQHRGNDLMCRRYVVYQNMLGKNPKQSDYSDIAYLFPNFFEVYKEYAKTQSFIDLLTSDKFTKAAFIIGDLSKIVGYGRDTKNKRLTELKKVMQDAYRVNVLFVLFTRSFEGLGDLNSGLRYRIFDAPDAREWGRLRVEEPIALNARLALIADSVDSTNAQRKFKRTLLKEEF